MLFFPNIKHILEKQHQEDSWCGQPFVPRLQLVLEMYWSYPEFFCGNLTIQISIIITYIA